MLTEFVEKTRRAEVRQAFRTARRITRMLQGTMGLEGQALDRKVLEQMTRETVRELLATS